MRRGDEGKARASWHCIDWYCDVNCLVHVSHRQTPRWRRYGYDGPSIQTDFLKKSVQAKKVRDYFYDTFAADETTSC